MSSIDISIIGIDQNYPGWASGDVTMSDVTIVFRHVARGGGGVSQMMNFINDLEYAIEYNDGKITMTVTDTFLDTEDQIYAKEPEIKGRKVS